MKLERSLGWLRNEFLKKETEGSILAAQEQALRTNSMMYSIDKTSETPLCRFGADATETVRLIVSGCKKLAQREYRKRHDKVALRVPWEMCRKYGIEFNDKWYDHQPLPTAESGEVRITWDMTIYTDKVLKHNIIETYLTSLEVYNYRPHLELLTCYGKSCFSKLRGVAETQ